jgi:5-methylcytosine-specific restriction endonuclease McrA
MKKGYHVKRPDGTCKGVCSRCHRQKNIGEFIKDARFKSGHRPECRQCSRDRVLILAIESRSKLTHKRCTACQETKVVDQFYKTDQRVSGYENHCRDCYEEKRNARIGRKRNARKNLNVGRNGPTRWCYGCNTEKPSESFVKSKPAKAGYHTYCKDCHATNATAYYTKNKEAILIREKKRRESFDYHADYVKRRLKLLAKNKARHARKKNAVVEKVSLERVLERDGYHCYICNQEVNPEHLSFDHVIPLIMGGKHSESNLKVAHKVCNSRKQARPFEQLTPFDKRGPND